MNGAAPASTALSWGVSGGIVANSTLESTAGLVEPGDLGLSVTLRAHLTRDLGKLAFMPRSLDRQHRDTSTALTKNCSDGRVK